MADSTPKKVAKRARRPRATPPAANEGGIHAMAEAANQQVQQIRQGAEPQTETENPKEAVEEVPQQSTTGGNEQESPSPQGKEETETRKPEIMNSGLTSGKPENLKTRNHEPSDSGEEDSDFSGYLGAAYGGVTDPYDDFGKVSTQLPFCVWKALKAAAPLHDIPVQQLLTDIVLGKKKPLPELHPELDQLFYQMALKGKLKR